MYKLLPFALFSGMVAATSLTLHDYPTYFNGVADNNPPYCEVSYRSLDLNRVTAWGSVSHDTCGKCVNVCGPAGCLDLLVIDLCVPGTDHGADHFDISQGAGAQIVGSDTGRYNSGISYQFVDAKRCQHIWSGQMFTSWLAPYGGWADLAPIADYSRDGSSPATSAQSTSTTTPAVAKSKETVQESPVPQYTPPAVQVAVASSSSVAAVATAPLPSTTTAEYVAPPSPIVQSTSSTSSTTIESTSSSSSSTTTTTSSSSSTSSSSTTSSTANSTSIRVFAEQTVTGAPTATGATTTTLGTSYKPISTGTSYNPSGSRNSTVSTQATPTPAPGAAGMISPSLATAGLVFVAALFFSGL